MAVSCKSPEQRRSGAGTPPHSASFRTLYLRGPSWCRGLLSHRLFAPALLCAVLASALHARIAARRQPPILAPQPQGWRRLVGLMPWRDEQVAVETLGPYAEALAFDPVPTKMLTAALLVTLGDAFSQAAAGGKAPVAYDWSRGLSFAVFGATYTGAFQHWWFQFLNEALPATPGAGDLHLLLIAAVKTCLCQFGTIPLIYLPLFFLITGLLRGLSLEQTIARGRSSYLPLLRRNVTYWIPVQLAQFLLVEPEWQVPYVCSAGFLWGVLLSRFAGRIPEQDVKASVAKTTCRVVEVLGPTV